MLKACPWLPIAKDQHWKAKHNLAEAAQWHLRRIHCKNEVAHWSEDRRLGRTLERLLNILVGFFDGSPCSLLLFQQKGVGHHRAHARPLTFTLYLLDTTPCLSSQSIQTYYSPVSTLSEPDIELSASTALQLYCTLPLYTSPQSSHTPSIHPLSLICSARYHQSPHSPPAVPSHPSRTLQPAPSRLLSSNLPRTIAAIYATPYSNQPAWFDPPRNH